MIYPYTHLAEILYEDGTMTKEIISVFMETK